MKSWREKILEADNLANMCKALNDMEEAFSEQANDTGHPPCVLAGISENELCDLPTFGGREPNDTQGIYSWDETHYLINDYEWKLELR